MASGVYLYHYCRFIKSVSVSFPHGYPFLEINMIAEEDIFDFVDSDLFPLDFSLLDLVSIEALVIITGDV